MTNVQHHHGMSSTTCGEGLPGIREKPLGPQRLCFIQGTSTQDNAEYILIEASQWQSQNPAGGHPSFLFVSYTSQQFTIRPGEILSEGEDVSNTMESESADHPSRVQANRKALTTLAAKVTREHCMNAFWIDFES